MIDAEVRWELGCLGTLLIFLGWLVCSRLDKIIELLKGKRDE